MSSCPSSTCFKPPVAASQTFSRPPKHPVATRLPSTLKPTVETVSGCLQYFFFPDKQPKEGKNNRNQRGRTERRICIEAEEWIKISMIENGCSHVTKRVLIFSIYFPSQHSEAFRLVTVSDDDVVPTLRMERSNTIYHTQKEASSPLSHGITARVLASNQSGIDFRQAIHTAVNLRPPSPLTLRIALQQYTTLIISRVSTTPL